MERERALEIVKKHYSADVVDGPLSEALETLIPELAESEGEKIRKELVAVFIEVRNRVGNEGYWHDLKVAAILDWLEKQKEKPNDRSGLNDFEIRLMDCMLSAQQYRQGSIDLGIVKPWAEELSELIEQPNKKWSKKQDDIIGYIRHILNDHAFEHNGLDVNGDYCTDEYAQADDFLRFLHPQLLWQRAKVGTRFPSEALVIADDGEPRLSKVAVNDCKYILVKDLLPKEDER